MDYENSIYGYLHEEGEIEVREDKQIQYKGSNKKACILGVRFHMISLFQKHVSD